jgi:biopolymer transport protein ExbB
MRITFSLRQLLLAFFAVFALAGAVAVHAQATPAAEATAAAPITDPAKPVTVAVENPYGIQALWAQGDFISKATLLILAIMSMGSWYIGIVKLLEQGRLFKEGQEARRQFWLEPTVQEGAKKLGEDSAFKFLADEGIKAATHHEGTMTEAIDLSSWIGMSMQRAYDEIADRLSGGLAFLATVGSTAPFVGLFGTVWGIYHALTAIGIAGQASIDKVAGPVGEALIMTAIGLAVAVPAVLAYNWLIRRNKTAIAQVRHFGSELQMVLLAGGKKGVRG